MQKALNAEIFWELVSIAKEKGVDFKKKWFENESMMMESVPVSIYELVKVLPREMQGKRHCLTFESFFKRSKEEWWAGYRYEDISNHGNDETSNYGTAPELVDALGKLLIWVIKEGWLR